jgi:hypothetical protein
MAPACIKLRRDAKKEELRVKAAKDALDLAMWKTCKQFEFRDDECMCDGPCVWKLHRLCENPPCTVLLAPGSNCRKKACCAYRKEKGIKPSRTRAGSKKPPPKVKKALKKVSNELLTSAKRLYAFSDSSDSDSERNFSDRSDMSLNLDGPDEKFDSDSDESEALFQMEGIVSGPCQNKGPNFGRYLVKWVGYDSDENTWEPRANLPPGELETFQKEMAKERAAIVTKTRTSSSFSM